MLWTLFVILLVLWLLGWDFTSREVSSTSFW